MTLLQERPKFASVMGEDAPDGVGVGVAQVAAAGGGGGGGGGGEAKDADVADAENAGECGIHEKKRIKRGKKRE